MNSYTHNSYTTTLNLRNLQNRGISFLNPSSFPSSLPAGTISPSSLRLRSLNNTAFVAPKASIDFKQSPDEAQALFSTFTGVPTCGISYKAQRTNRKISRTSLPNLRTTRLTSPRKSQDKNLKARPDLSLIPSNPESHLKHALACITVVGGTSKPPPAASHKPNTSDTKISPQSSRDSSGATANLTALHHANSPPKN